jgi:hypothetical protein
MNDPDYTITVKLNKVTEGDVADIAQAIYDSYSHECDVDLGDFEIAVSKGKFTTDWEPLT